MTQRLPIPGGDDGDWGNILNSYLEVSLASDGTLNPNVVSDSQVSSNASINPAKIAGVAEIETNKNQPNGYAGLDSSSQIPVANIPTGTTSATVAIGNDSRIVGAIQSGATAGGDLSGTYPNPTVGQINGISISGTPTTGQVITATNSTTASWSVVDVNVLGTPSNPVTSASATRPTGLTVVYWQCTTQPTNWVSGDIWINNS